MIWAVPRFLSIRLLVLEQTLINEPWNDCNWFFSFFCLYLNFEYVRRWFGALQWFIIRKGCGWKFAALGLGVTDGGINITSSNFQANTWNGFKTITVVLSELTLEIVQRHCWSYPALCSVFLIGGFELSWPEPSIDVILSILKWKKCTLIRKVQSEVMYTTSSIEFERMLSVMHCLVTGSTSILPAFPLHLQIRWQVVDYIFTLPSSMKKPTWKVRNLLKGQRIGTMVVWKLWLVGDIGK